MNNRLESDRDLDLVTTEAVSRWRSLPEVIASMEQISTALALAMDLLTRSDFDIQQE